MLITDFMKLHYVARLCQLFYIVFYLLCFPNCGAFQKVLVLVIFIVLLGYFSCCVTFTFVRCCILYAGSPHKK